MYILIYHPEGCIYETAFFKISTYPLHAHHMKALPVYRVSSV